MALLVKQVFEYWTVTYSTLNVDSILWNKISFVGYSVQEGCGKRLYIKHKFLVVMLLGNLW